MFGLHRFKLHRHLVDGTIKSVWFRQEFGLLRVRFRQVSLYCNLSINLHAVYVHLNTFNHVTVVIKERTNVISIIYIPRVV